MVSNFRRSFRITLKFGNQGIDFLKNFNHQGTELQIKTRIKEPDQPVDGIILDITGI